MIVGASCVMAAAWKSLCLSSSDRLAADPPDLLQAKLTSASAMTREMIVDLRFIEKSFFSNSGCVKRNSFTRNRPASQLIREAKRPALLSGIQPAFFRGKLVWAFVRLGKGKSAHLSLGVGVFDFGFGFFGCVIFLGNPFFFPPPRGPPRHKLLGGFI